MDERIISIECSILLVDEWIISIQRSILAMDGRIVSIQPFASQVGESLFQSLDLTFLTSR